MMNRNLMGVLLVSAILSAPAMAKNDTNDTVHYVKPTAAVQVSGEDVARVWSTAESDHGFRFNAEQQGSSVGTAALDSQKVWSQNESDHGFRAQSVTAAGGC